MLKKNWSNVDLFMNYLTIDETKIIKPLHLTLG